MDGYPTGSLDHNVPLLVASGLNSDTNELPLSAELKEQSILLRSEIPPIDGKNAEALSQYFKDVDSSAKSWSAFERSEQYRFRVRTTGRVSERGDISRQAAVLTIRVVVFITAAPSSSSRRYRTSKRTPDTAFALFAFKSHINIISRWSDRRAMDQEAPGPCS